MGSFYQGRSCVQKHSMSYLGGLDVHQPSVITEKVKELSLTL